MKSISKPCHYQHHYLSHYRTSFAGISFPLTLQRQEPACEAWWLGTSVLWFQITQCLHFPTVIFSFIHGMKIIYGVSSECITFTAAMMTIKHMKKNHSVWGIQFFSCVCTKTLYPLHISCTWRKQWKYCFSSACYLVPKRRMNLIILSYEFLLQIE